MVDLEDLAIQHYNMYGYYPHGYERIEMWKNDPPKPVESKYHR